MSPEQAEGKPVDSRSDVFSLGSVLYEMLTGRRAFERETRASTLSAVVHGEPPEPPDVLPREVDRVLRRCLRKDPQRRWQTMSDLKLALEELKDESDSGALTHRPGVPAPGGRTRVALWVGSLAILLGACGSRNGRLLAYVRRAGLRTQWRVEVRLRDLDTGREYVYPGTGASLTMAPRLNEDGSLLGYCDVAEGGWGGYAVKLPAGTVRKLCEGCSVAGFLSGGREALVYSASGQFMRHELETGRQARVLTVAGPVFEPDLSPDDLWVAFTTGTTIYAASLERPETIPIAEDRNLVNCPRWSPDGGLLYYLSHRDGWTCVWAQRLDPRTKQPLGDAFAVLHCHGNPGFRGMPRGTRSVAVSADRLFITFGLPKSSRKTPTSIEIPTTCGSAWTSLARRTV